MLIIETFDILSQSFIVSFVLANGSMSTNTSGESEIRQKLIDADMVDCMIILPAATLEDIESHHYVLTPAAMWEPKPLRMTESPFKKKWQSSQVHSMNKCGNLSSWML